MGRRKDGRSVRLAVGLDVFYQGGKSLWVGGVVYAPTILGGDRHQAAPHKMDIEGVGRLTLCEVKMYGHGAAVIIIAADQTAPAPGKQIAERGAIVGGFQNVQKVGHNTVGLLAVLYTESTEVAGAAFVDNIRCDGIKTGEGIGILRQEGGKGPGPQPPGQKTRHQQDENQQDDIAFFHRVTSFGNSFL